MAGRADQSTLLEADLALGLLYLPDSDLGRIVRHLADRNVNWRLYQYQLPSQSDPIGGKDLLFPDSLSPTDAFGTVVVVVVVDVPGVPAARP